MEPRREPPEPARWPRCPVCGAEMEWYYVDAWERPAGCENCLERRDAWEDLALREPGEW